MTTTSLLHEWAQWMQAVGMRPRTVKSRLELVDLFARRTGTAPERADWRAVSAFMSRGGISQGTRCTNHSHLRAWFGWLILTDRREDDPMRKIRAPRRPRRRPRPVSLEQLEQLLRTPHHRRTTVMVLLAAYAGLRVSEIATIRGEDIAGGDLHVHGKGGHEDWVPVHEIIAECALHMPATGWWFPSHVRPGEPIRGQSVSAIISQLMTRADVPGTPHCLRHFFGTESLRSSGGNLALVKELMRHASVGTTAMYTEVDDRDRRAAIDGLPRPTTIAALRAA